MTRRDTTSRSFIQNLLQLIVLPVFLGYCVLFVSSAQAQTTDIDLTSLSLEQLMDIEITSVARKPQKLAETPAAAFIITQEDIRRSGAMTIMHAIRMAPGVQVAQIDGNKWAVTARGANGRFANKLLVLMDGRTIYSPFFSGVLWESQDIPLEYIDRIEVIRGPGASVWGANAVNGIINIITQSAEDTQGATVVAGGGTHERAFGSAGYGGQLGESTHYRLFVKASDRGSFDEYSASDGNNDWQHKKAGFRLDGRLSESDEWSCRGSVHKGETGQSYTAPIFELPFQRKLYSDSEMEGGYLMGLWTHQFAKGSESALQLHYTHEKYDDLSADVREDTVDLDFQHRFSFGERQEITWGAAYRFTRLEADGGVRISFTKNSQHDDLFSAFFQDEIELVKDSVLLTIGSKFEHNDYTGTEIQPSARLLWEINDIHTLWGSVSRAVRTPAWAETTTYYLGAVMPPDPTLPPEYTFPTGIYTLGIDKYDSEDVWAYEVGFRTRPDDWVSFDLAVFYNDYKNLGSLTYGWMSFGTDPVPHNQIIGLYANDMKGHSYGFEAAADFLPNDWWKLRFAYNWLKISLDLDDSFGPEAADFRESSPEHQVSLLSMMKLNENLELDTWFRYVDRLEAHDVPSYVTLDARIAWTPVEGLEFTVVGQNLLEDGHTEYREQYLDTAYVEIEPIVYGKITWQF